MRWSPEDIQAKADRLLARGPGRLVLSADTLQLLLIALRSYAEALGRRPPDAYVVEAWSCSPDTPGEVVAMSDKYILAKAAFDTMCEAEPRYRVTLRQGCRVMTVRNGGTVDW